jgi:hypothetical protein
MSNIRDEIKKAMLVKAFEVLREVAKGFRDVGTSGMGDKIADHIEYSMKDLEDFYKKDRTRILFFSTRGEVDER